ncbi:MAG TPA: hypothetical protein VGD78_23570 [Chthoniobacterales bacterium]
MGSLCEKQATYQFSSAAGFSEPVVSRTAEFVAKLEDGLVWQQQGAI